MTSRTNKQRDNKIIPLYFVAFFATFMILDGIFVYLATSTHRGVVTEHAYEKGLAYNAVLDGEAKQQALGVTSEITLAGAWLTATLIQQDMPLEQAHVQAYFKRISQAGSDFSLPLAEIGKGVYAAEVTFPAIEQWNVKLVATWNTHSYQTTKRILPQ